jgi:hypothetical protein
MLLLFFQVLEFLRQHSDRNDLHLASDHSLILKAKLLINLNRGGFKVRFYLLKHFNLLGRASPRHKALKALFLSSNISYLVLFRQKLLSENSMTCLIFYLVALKSQECFVPKILENYELFFDQSSINSLFLGILLL